MLGQNYNLVLLGAPCTLIHTSYMAMSHLLSLCMTVFLHVKWLTLWDNPDRQHGQITLHTRATNNILNRTQSINQTPNLRPDQKNKIYLFNLALKRTKNTQKGRQIFTTLHNFKVHAEWFIQTAWVIFACNS
jgi:hypothetical protein